MKPSDWNELGKLHRQVVRIEEEIETIANGNPIISLKILTADNPFRGEDLSSYHCDKMDQVSHEITAELYRNIIDSLINVLQLKLDQAVKQFDYKLATIKAYGN